MISANALAQVEALVEDACAAGTRVAVVIPCFNVAAHIGEVISTLPSFVSDVVVVNDASTDQTGAVLESLKSARIHVIELQQNRGVGGATLAGIERAVELEADIIVKVDGDGQMDPAQMPFLIAPVLRGQADFAKGNRFRNRAHLAQMPLGRKLGNASLSLINKVASGYWNVFDPTNGYFALRGSVFELLPRNFLHERYFFECSLLIALGVARAVVKDVPMPARYRGETSNLSLSKAMRQFPLLMAQGFLRRLWYSKCLHDLTVEGILFIFGVLTAGTGLLFGFFKWYDYAIVQGVAAPTGTVMVAVLPVILGLQMLQTALLLDVLNVPKEPLGTDPAASSFRYDA